MSNLTPSQESHIRAQDIVKSIEGADAVHSKDSENDFEYSPSHDIREQSPIHHPTSRRHENPGANSRTSNLPFVSNPGVAIPEVLFFEPSSGAPGNVITVYVRSRQPLELNPGPKPSLIFAGLQIPSALWPKGANSGFHEYAITAIVPAMPSMNSLAMCSLYLSINDATQNNASPISIGNFEYWRPMEHQAHAPLQPVSRKRRASSGSALSNDLSIKRMASQSFPATSADSSLLSIPPFEYSLSTPSQYQQIPYDLPASTIFLQQPGHTAIKYESGYSVPYDYATYPVAHSSQLAPSHGDSASSFIMSNATVEPARLIGTIDNARAVSSAADAPVNIRTSFLRQRASRPRLRTHASAPQFNPYSIPKATLQIQGDLSTVLENWTKEECTARRRIVEFDRQQAGSIITTSFQIVSQAEWDSTRISVNCIWWKERKEAFITSVDMISLLESIMALRFTLQEKNRIRRNLEGFRPLTIGKSKPDKEPVAEDVEEFFKVIMSLDEPRPRSIEKDVKVFPWSNLGLAMKKVVDKYSASYASTAGTLVPAPSSSRIPFDSPRPGNTTHSEENSSPSQSVTRGSGAPSPHRSPYSMAQGTAATLAALPAEIGLPNMLFSDDPESYWQTDEPEDSAYQLASGISDTYQLPDFGASNLDPIGAPLSPVRGLFRSRMDTNPFYHDAGNFRSYHD